MALYDFNNPNGKDPNGANNTSGAGGANFPSGINVVNQLGMTDIVDILINYNKKFKQAGQLEYRDKQISQVLTVLASMKKPNALLIGPTGCGKSAIIKEIARMLQNSDPNIPAHLKQSVIYELPLSQLVAKSNHVGEMEEHIKAVVDFFSNPTNNAILYIDDIHQIVNNREPEYAQIGRLLKPALASGQFRVIGTTTPQEARKHLNESALNRNFSDIIIPELSIEETIEIIAKLKNQFTNYHQILMPDGMEEKLVHLSEKHKKAGTHRPDTAITLMDRSMADAALKFQKKKRAAIASQNTSLIAAINNMPMPSLSSKDIESSALVLLSGSDTLDRQKYKMFEANLNGTIIGQEPMKKILLDCIQRRTLGAFKNTKPLSMLFAGVTGTGKSETAKTIAKSLGNAENSIITINMTEYNSSASLNRIIGSPDGYVGSDSEREMPFDSLETNPNQVVLLDEFEKADPAVQRLFMQALDEGYFKTNRDKIVDFSHAIIIATTNAGVEELAKRPIGLKNNDENLKTESDIINALKKYFDMELLNRFEFIIPFQSITKEQYRDILVVKYNKLVKEISHNLASIKVQPDHIDPGYPSDVLDKLVEDSYNPLFNGRPAERTMRKYLENTLLENDNNTVITFL